MRRKMVKLIIFLCAVMFMAVMSALKLSVVYYLDRNTKYFPEANHAAYDVSWGFVASTSLDIIVASALIKDVIDEEKTFAFMDFSALFLICASEIALACLMDSYSGKFYDILERNMTEYWNDYTHRGFERGAIFDNIQTDFECCGLNGPADYYELEVPLPPTCYKKADYNASSWSWPKTNSCYNAVTHYYVALPRDIAIPWPQVKLMMYNYTGLMKLIIWYE